MSAETQHGAQLSEQQWLVRSAGNQIIGPISAEQVRGMIEHGKLQLGDELCGANTFWFYLHEANEVRTQLGVELPRHLYVRKAEDATHTETDTDLERTDPELAANRAALGGAGGLPELLELDSSPEDLGENTAVMSNRAFRDFRHKKNPDLSVPVSPQAQAPAPTVGASGRVSWISRAAVFRFFTYVMMVAAVVLLIAIINLLQQPPA